MDTVTYSAKDAVVSFNDEISEASVSCCIQAIDLLLNYYQHTDIKLVINSGGGSGRALSVLLDELGRRRTEGIVFSTIGSYTVASAAAILVASGEPHQRIVSRHSYLLFHHARVQSQAGQTITARDASELSSMLEATSGGMVARLTNQIAKAFGGIDPLINLALARCNLLRINNAQVASEAGIEAGKATPLFLKEVLRMWTRCKTTGNLRPFQEYVSKRFDRDSIMDHREAFSLVLIDQIRDVPSLSSYGIAPTVSPPKLRRAA